MAEELVVIRLEAKTFYLPLGRCRAWEAAKNVIRNAVRRERLQQKIEREEFDLVDPNGVVIGPFTWPTGVRANTVLVLNIWDEYGDEGVPIPAPPPPMPNQQPEEDEDWQNRDQIMQNLRDAILQHVPTMQANQQLMQQNLIAMNQRQNAMQQGQTVLAQREQTLHDDQQALHDDRADLNQREHNVHDREESLDRREGRLRIREARDHIEYDQDRLRAWEACLNILACRTRLGDCCTRSSCSEPDA